MNSESKYFDDFYNYVLEQIEPSCKYLKAAFDIVSDIIDRRGLKHPFKSIDGEIQDEIIDTWVELLKQTL